MSTQSQAYRIDNDVKAVHNARPRFRVIEGGLAVNGSLAIDEGHVRQPEALGHVYSLRTRVSLVAMTVAVCLVLASLWMLSDILVARAARSSFDSASYETITVHTGDSLWTIADEHPVEGRTTAEVARYIRERNQLADTCLYPGMELSVPQASRA